MTRVKGYGHVPDGFESVNPYKELVGDVTENDGFSFPHKFPLLLTTEVPFLLRRLQDLVESVQFVEPAEAADIHRLLIFR